MTEKQTQTDLGPLSPSNDPTEARPFVVRRMRRAFLSLCRCGDALFSPYRITTDQYALIRAVQRSPGMRQADLGNIIFAEPNTVTAMIVLLEKRGIVRRKPSPSDRRARLVTLTAHGEMVMQRLSDDWDPMRTRLNECFAGEAGQQALLILDRVYEVMRQAREELIKPTEKLEIDGIEFSTEAKVTQLPLPHAVALKQRRTKASLAPKKRVARKRIA